MTPLDRYLSDAAIAGQIRLLQFTASEQKKVLAVLTQTQNELKIKLMGDLTDYGKAVWRLPGDRNAGTIDHPPQPPEKERDPKGLRQK